MIAIREAGLKDGVAGETGNAGEVGDAVWEMLEPVIRAGEEFALPAEMERGEALEYWFAAGNRVWVAEEDGVLVGSYYLRTNQRGGGAHVGNCAYVTAGTARGRGVAARMCEHSLREAREAGFRALQFNFVVSTNGPAVHLWIKYGFRVVGRLPGAFRLPNREYVEVLVMWRDL